MTLYILWICILILSHLRISFGLHVITPSKINSKQISFLSMMASDINEEGLKNPMERIIQSQFKQNKQVVYGVLQRDVDPKTIPSENERERLRDDAANNLVNIDKYERERRSKLSFVFSIISTIIYSYSIKEHLPFYMKSAYLSFPMFLSVGFYFSSKEGL